MDNISVADGAGVSDANKAANPGIAESCDTNAYLCCQMGWLADACQECPSAAAQMTERNLTEIRQTVRLTGSRAASAAAFPSCFAAWTETRGGTLMQCFVTKGLGFLLLAVGPWQGRGEHVAGLLLLCLKRPEVPVTLDVLAEALVHAVACCGLWLDLATLLFLHPLPLGLAVP